MLQAILDVYKRQVKNIAYQCNAYGIRSSVSMGGADYLYGANSMIAAPDGRILGNLDVYKRQVMGSVMA